jgi:hypothetical protein
VGFIIIDLLLTKFSPFAIYLITYPMVQNII